MKFYYEAIGCDEEEVTFEELEDKVRESGPDVTVELDWIDDDKGLHFAETVYGMYC